jgi:hypothetical protein
LISRGVFLASSLESDEDGDFEVAALSAGVSGFVLSASIIIYMPADTSKNKRGRA